MYHDDQKMAQYHSENNSIQKKNLNFDRSSHGFEMDLRKRGSFLAIWINKKSKKILSIIIASVFMFLGISVYAEEVLNIKKIEGRDLLSQKYVKVSVENKKALVVVFLSAKCPCSNSHNEELKSLMSLHKNMSFIFVHSNMDEKKEMSVPYFQNAQLGAPVIDDDNAELADLLKALKTPHAFVFSPAGSLLYKGGVSSSNDCATADRKLLREALDDIQAGVQVRTPNGRALGCVISRGKKTNF